MWVPFHSYFICFSRIIMIRLSRLGRLRGVTIKIFCNLGARIDVRGHTTQVVLDCELSMKVHLDTLIPLVRQWDLEKSPGEEKWKFLQILSFLLLFLLFLSEHPRNTPCFNIRTLRPKDIRKTSSVGIIQDFTKVFVQSKFLLSYNFHTTHRTYPVPICCIDLGRLQNSILVPTLYRVE